MTTDYDGEQQLAAAEPAPEAAPEQQVAAAEPEPQAVPEQPQPTTATDAATERERLLAERARIDAQLRETAPPAPEEPFGRSTWMGQTLLTCSLCPWTSFREADMYQHVNSDAYAEIHARNAAAGWGSA